MFSLYGPIMIEINSQEYCTTGIDEKGRAPNK